MRVLLVGNHWTPGPGGAETMLVLTADLLRRTGHQVVPLALAEDDTLPTPAADLLPPPVLSRSRVRQAAAGVWSRAAAAAVREAVRRHRPDVAHVHHVFEGLTLAVLDVLHRHGIPVVVTLHDYRPVCRNYRFLRDRVVAGGLPAQRVRVVPNPVVVPRDAADPHRPPVVCYTGRLVAEKGLHVLLDASRALPPGVRVRVTGSGRLATDLEARLRRERLPVDLLGPARPAEVAHELRRAAVAVLPALWWENCPMAVAGGRRRRRAGRGLRRRRDPRAGGGRAHRCAGRTR